METKEFDNYEDALNLVEDLYEENKWAVEIRQKSQGGYRVSWIPHKTYVTYDGKTVHDEVWITEKGELMCIQDMEEEHVRNALRMVLRNERNYRELLQKALAIVNEADEDSPEFDDTHLDSQVDPQDNNSKRILH